MIHSVEEFLEIVSSEDLEVSRRAAFDSAPIEVWLEVIQKFPEYRKIFAHNKPIPIEILEILALDRDLDVRYEVACRRKLSEKLFWLLARDPEWSVRGRIMQNPKVPSDVLEFLRSDEDEWVRLGASAELGKRDSLIRPQ